MTEQTVDVYLLAQARAGIERATLVRNLAGLFKKDAPAIEKILARPRTLVKAGVDTATAEKYCRAIRQAGCECELVTHEPVKQSAATTPASAPTPAPPSTRAVEASHPSAQAGVDAAEEKNDTGMASTSARRESTRPELHRATRSRFVLPLAILMVILIAVTLTVLIYRNTEPSVKSSAGSAVSSAAKSAPGDAGKTQPEVAPKPLELLRTYSDDKSISLTTPTDWKGERRLNPAAAIGVANIRDNLYAVVLRENKLPFGSDFNLLRYSELITQGLKKSTQDFYVQQASRQLSINGIAAQQAALAAKVDGINIIYVITTLETNEHFYVIYAWTLASRFPEQQALLKQVSESFTLH